MTQERAEQIKEQERWERRSRVRLIIALNRATTERMHRAYQKALKDRHAS